MRTKIEVRTRAYIVFAATLGAGVGTLVWFASGLVGIVVYGAFVAATLFLAAKITPTFQRIASELRTEAYTEVAARFRPVDLAKFKFISLEFETDGDAIREAARLAYKIGGSFGAPDYVCGRLYAVVLIQGKEESLLPPGFIEMLNVDPLLLAQTPHGGPTYTSSGKSGFHTAHVVGTALAYAEFLGGFAAARSLAPDEAVGRFRDFLVELFTEQAKANGEAGIEVWAKSFADALQNDVVLLALQDALGKRISVHDEAGLPASFIEAAFVKPRLRRALREQLPVLIADSLRHPFSASA